MRTAIPFAGGEVEAILDGEIWRVRLGELEESSPYLDYALSQLLDAPASEVHQLATRLIEQLLVESQAGGTKAPSRGPSRSSGGR